MDADDVIGITLAKSFATLVEKDENGAEYQWEFYKSRFGKKVDRALLEWCDYNIMGQHRLDMRALRQRFFGSLIERILDFINTLVVILVSLWVFKETQNPWVFSFVAAQSIAVAINIIVTNYNEQRSSRHRLPKDGQGEGGD